MAISTRPSSIENLSLDKDVQLKIPFYDETILPEDYCARYVRLSSDFIFGKKFPVADAWKMRDMKRIYGLNINNSEFPHLAKLEFVLPGMLVGLQVNDTKYNKDTREYTHLSLYLGTQKGKPLFLEQYGTEIRTMNLNDYMLGKMEIREVLDTKIHN